MQVVSSLKGRDTKKRRIRKELLDELLAGYEKPEDLTGPEGLLKDLTGALVERALAAELTDHLCHAPGAPAVSGNARNGTSPKTLTTEQGEVPIEVPRDRNGTFGDPALPFPVGSAAAPASAASLARPTEPAQDDMAAPLLGVTPNPAREAADIAYTVGKAGEGGALEVSVLDVAGRSVRTLEREAARAGSHALAWDLRDERGTRVARGLYFVRVSTRDATRVKRVVVW